MFIQPLKSFKGSHLFINLFPFEVLQYKDVNIANFVHRGRTRINQFQVTEIGRV